MRADFFSPDSLRRIYRLTDAPSSDADAVTAQTAYAAAVYAYVAMRYRSEKYSEPPLMVVEESDDGDEWLPDHPLAGLLDMPSPDFDMGELLRISRLYRDSTGSVLWVKDLRRDGQVGRLTPFSGDEFRVHAQGERMYGRFEIRTAAGTVNRTPDEVVYFRETSPYSWQTGLPPLHAALGMLNLGASATAAVRSILKNALFPSMVIQASEKWSPTDVDFERWKAQLNDYASMERKGEPLALLGGGSATRVSLSLDEVIPSEILNRVEAATAAAFGIPAVVLGFLSGMENSPWSQMSEARRMCYEDTLEPMWARDGKTLTRQLLRAAPGTRGEPIDADPAHFVRFDTSTIRALQADRKQQAETAQLVEKAWTVDEIRVFTGQEPLPEDDPRGKLIPGLMQTVDPFADPGEDDEETEDAPPAKHASTPVETKVDARGARWKLWAAWVHGQQLAWELAASEQLDADRRAVLDLARATLEPAKAAAVGLESKGPPPPPFSADPESIRRLIKALAEKLDLENAWGPQVKPLVDRTARRAVDATAAQVGLSFDVLEPGLLKYVERHAAELVSGIADTTRTAVRDALRQSLEKGEGIPEITKRLEELGAFAPSRAELIARTETTTVTNHAGRQSLAGWAKENSARVTKTWLSARDDRVRDEHLELDGETRSIDKAFSNGLLAPGEPNCRCTLIYEIAEEPKSGSAPVATKVSPFTVHVDLPPEQPKKRTVKTIELVNARGEKSTATVTEDEAE